MNKKIIIFFILFFIQNFAVRFGIFLALRILEFNLNSFLFRKKIIISWNSLFFEYLFIKVIVRITYVWTVFIIEYFFEVKMISKFLYCIDWTDILWITFLLSNFFFFLILRCEMKGKETHWPDAFSWALYLMIRPHSWKIKHNWCKWRFLLVNHNLNLVNRIGVSTIQKLVINTQQKAYCLIKFYQVHL